MAKRGLAPVQYQGADGGAKMGQEGGGKGEEGREEVEGKDEDEDGRRKRLRVKLERKLQ